MRMVKSRWERLRERLYEEVGAITPNLQCLVSWVVVVFRCADCAADMVDEGRRSDSHPGHDVAGFQQERVDTRRLSP